MKPTATHQQSIDLRFGKPLAGWRLRMYVVIFEADTRAGRIFDLGLIALIVAVIGFIFACVL